MKICKENNFWLAAFLVFLIDQFTKLWALYRLPLEEEIVINSYLSFQRVFNEATVLLSFHLPFGLTVDQFRFFWVLIAISITLGIWWTIKQPALNQPGWVEEFSKTGLFLILGSSWGNAFDRIFRKEGVVDFLQINYFKGTVPIVNFADIIIYVGEIALISAWVLIIINYYTQKLSDKKKIKKTS